MRTTRLAAIAAVTAIGLAGCTSSSGGRAAEEAAKQAKAGRATTPEMTVALITHSGPGDTFWDIVRKGAEDAAQKDNVRLEYAADPDGAGQANLVQQAIDKKVDGIAVTLSKPEAMKANVEAAVKAGIPVTGLNGGLDVWKDYGLVGYFGQDEKIAGKEAGARLAEEGAKKVLCVIHEQGNVGHEARCAGVKEEVPSTEILYVTGSDMPGVQSSLTSKLQQDKDIDNILTLGGPFAMTAIKSTGDAGSKARIVTFDTSTELIQAIKDGSIAWAVDQQPYLQGYLAVDALWLQKFNGNEIGGGQPVLTGPAFIDKTNVASVEKYAKSGKR
ncbi:MAG: sugar ABC transporter substrate-binding protein [Micrococcales bacterium]|nr:sugar ABC transporter substrate-binding protein [Micrococcales bacterium]